MSDGDQVRKSRSDKGSILATARDQYCIAWIADQYAIRGDQIRRLLSRFPDREKPFKGDLIAETTTRDQISRWRRAGWIDYARVLADMPGWAWVTKKGLQLVGLDEMYTARAPASTRLNHLYGVNQLRLWMDGRGFEWQSERRFRAEELAKQQSKKGISTGPIPDGIITVKNGRVALEVELSAKKPADLEAKLVRLVRHYDYSTGAYAPVWPTIWFYVSTEAVKRAVEKAIGELRDDEQGRVSVGVEADLVASRFR